MNGKVNMIIMSIINYNISKNTNTIIIIINVKNIYIFLNKEGNKKDNNNE